LVLFYVPCLLDIADGRTGLEVGERVKVIKPHGCPPPNESSEESRRAMMAPKAPDMRRTTI